MNFLKKQLASASKLVNNAASGVLGSEKCDKTLEEFQQHLKHMDRMLVSMRSSLMLVKTHATKRGQAEMKLAKDVSAFYRQSKSRQRSIEHFMHVQHQLEEMSIGSYSFQYDDTVVSVIDEWRHLAAQTLTYIQETSRDIGKFRREDAELKRMKKAIERLKQQNRVSDEHRSMYKSQDQKVKQIKQKVLKQKDEIKQMTGKLVNERYRIFDECFVRIMEAQVSYFEDAKKMVDALRPKIEQYRKHKPLLLSGPVSKLIAPLPSFVADPSADLMPPPMERPNIGSEKDSDEDSESSGLDEPVALPTSNSKRSKSASPAPQPAPGRAARSPNSRRSTTRSPPKKKAASASPQPQPQPKPQAIPTIPLSSEDAALLEKAKPYKAKGGSCFKESHFEEAIKWFSQAVSIMGFDDTKASDQRNDEVLDFVCGCLSNRAMCHKQLYEHKKIVADTSLCLRLKPNKSVVGKCLLRRALAYEALSKEQLALEDFLSLRNMGITNSVVLKGVSRMKKAGTSMPKQVKTYKSRLTAAAKSHKKQQQQQPAAATTMPPRTKSAPPVRHNNHTQAQAAQAAAAQNPINIFDMGESKPQQQQQQQQQQQHQASSSNTSTTNILGWDSFVGGDSSSAAQSQPNLNQQQGGEDISWLSSLSNPDETNVDVLNAYGSAAPPQTTAAHASPASNNAAAASSNGDDGIFDYDTMFEEKPKPKNPKQKQGGGSGSGSTLDSKGRATRPGASASDSHANIFGGSGGKSGLTAGHDVGGPISQMRSILNSMDDQLFWRFAHDNLAPDKYMRIPRDRSQAVEYVISLGINNPSFVVNWEESMEEKKYQAGLDKWEFRAGIRKDLMSLLCGLHNVIELVPWQGRKWKRVNLGDMQDPKKRRLNYKKAMLVVHPDHNASAPAAQRAIAERAFNALTEALKKE